MSTVDDIYKSYTKYPEIFFREPFLELILKKYIKWKDDLELTFWNTILWEANTLLFRFLSERQPGGLELKMKQTPKEGKNDFFLLDHLLSLQSICCFM